MRLPSCNASVSAHLNDSNKGIVTTYVSNVKRYYRYYLNYSLCPWSGQPASYQYPNTFHHTIPTVANTSNSTTAITKPTPHHLPMET